MPSFIKNYWKKAILFLFDLIVFFLAYFFVALASNQAADLYKVLIADLIFAGIKTVFRLAFGTYRQIYRHADAYEYFQFFVGEILSLIVSVAVFFIFEPLQYVNLLALVFAIFLSILISFFSRIAYRFFAFKRSMIGSKNKKAKKYAAIFGAGEAGRLLAHELNKNPKSEFVPFCFFDDDISKVNCFVHGIKVLGTGFDAVKILKKTDVRDVIIAIPTITRARKKAFLADLISEGFNVKEYEYGLNDAEITQKNKIRDLTIEELLFRNVVKITADTKSVLQGKTVMVTGGGGSIGSELCRQIAKAEPKKLIILDIYENNAYDIQNELLRKHGKNLDLEVIISSVRDREKIDKLFARFRPEIVFHAAAHKHVPLMEDACDEAIKNNVFGTLNVADAAEKYGVEKMVLISTDKAVNPTNVMGASKRLCEMIIQSRKNSKTEYSAVRFGNVLGSNGSVVPLFKRQIEEGGPVTVTDKRIIRYFMTIPEAVTLILETAIIAEKSEIFVLDMGKPVKILELAENMIRLSGFKPYEDIQIEEIGLRPGEKLYEEILIDYDNCKKTENEKIFVEQLDTLSREEMDKKLELLKEAADSGDNEKVKEIIKATVPTYCVENINAKEAKYI